MTTKRFTPTEAAAEIKRLQLRVNALIEDKKRLQFELDSLKYKRATDKSSLFDSMFGGGL